MQDLQEYISDRFPVLGINGENDISSALGGALQSSCKPVLKTVCILLCLVIIAALIRAVSDALSKHSAPAELCICLVCSAAVYEAVKSSCDAVRSCLDGIAVLMDAMSGAMCVLYGLTGNIVGGSSSVTVIMLVLQVTRIISDKVIMPLIMVCFGTVIMSGFGFDAGIGRLSAVVKRAVVVLCTAAAAVVCTVLSYQTVISRSADNAALRTVKFASSSFIPVIGSSLSDSASSVASALSAIKTASGAGGVISILVLIIPAVISVASAKLCMRTSSFFSGVLGVDNVGAFFDRCNDILSMLLSVTLTCGVIFTVACALFCI